MPNYRRCFVPGATYFFTLVTANRSPLFGNAEAVRLLGNGLRAVKRTRPFTVVAAVLLPDHMHMIWSLPSCDSDFPTRIAAVKAHFTRQWLGGGGTERSVTRDQARQRRRGVWQPRYFEHMIRDEADLLAHVDYVHYNPVKHGLVARPSDWPHSSFLAYVRRGDYPMEWGRLAACSILDGFGEPHLE